MQISERRGVDADVVCVGIDLAWFSHNPSGVAIWKNREVVAWRGDLGDDDAIIEFIRSWLQPEQAAVIAVDAPLRVPNETGARPCERALARRWGHAQAAARPAFRAQLARDGVVRGEALAALLCTEFGAEETPYIDLGPGKRFVCEVYPHPAMVVLFGLDRTLKYKRGPREQRLTALAQYRELMQSLAGAMPPLYLPAPLTQTPIEALRGKAYKEFEDTLDAILCAYVAAHLWHHGPAGAEIFGDVETGHIVVPRLPESNIPPRVPGETAFNQRTARVAKGANTMAESSSGLTHQEAGGGDRQEMQSRHPAGTLPPDTLNARIGVLTRREVEARILGPVVEAMAQEFGRERVVAVLRDTIIRIAQQQGADLAVQMGGDSLEQFADSLQYWTQDSALEIELLEETPERLDFNVTRCRYAELYRALGLEELGAVLSCNRDYALIDGFNPEVELTRTQTIMEGAACCDFRYRRVTGDAGPEQ